MPSCTELRFNPAYAPNLPRIHACLCREFLFLPESACFHASTPLGEHSVHIRQTALNSQDHFTGHLSGHRQLVHCTGPFDR